MRYRWIVAAAIAWMLSGCAPPTMAKKDAFPGMYDKKPVSLLVLSPINLTTAAEAKDSFLTTIALPLAEKGYYVFPIDVVNELLRMEGIPDTELLLDSSPRPFKDKFGADAVMYVTINKWDTSYFVLGGNVTVGISYILKDTTSGDVLWQYAQTLVVDTSGGNQGGGIAGLIVSAVATAVKTAMTDYVPVARQVNNIAFGAFPAGKYSPKFGLDGEDRVTVPKAADAN